MGQGFAGQICESTRVSGDQLDLDNTHKPTTVSAFQMVEGKRRLSGERKTREIVKLAGPGRISERVMNAGKDEMSPAPEALNVCVSLAVELSFVP